MGAMQATVTDSTTARTLMVRAPNSLDFLLKPFTNRTKSAQIYEFNFLKSLQFPKNQQK
jgi:hypothetical protein